MKTILSELTDMYQMVDPNELDDFCHELAVKLPTQVVGIGAGRMGYSLRAFIMRLTHFGFDASMLGDTNVRRIGKKSIVLINSSSGETPSNILFAQQAKNAEANVFTITCNKSSSIGLLSDNLLTLPTIESHQMMKTIYEQFSYLLLDYIAQRLCIIKKLDKNWVSENHSILE